MTSIIYSNGLSETLYRLRLRFLITMMTGLLISLTSFRFSSDWRHADSGPRAWFYVFCCTFAANYIADDPLNQIRHWRVYV